MEPVRVRVVFEDLHVLSKSQKRDGLNRFWVRLRPDLDTIASLASYIVQTLGLEDSCPRGLVLSMDEFVLPPFESTQILVDNDIISVRVRKRRGALTEAIKFDQDKNHIEDSKTVDKQPPCLCDSIVVAEEFEKESGGYQSEHEEDEEEQHMETVRPETPLDGKTCSKRKRDSNRLPKSKKKKTKLSTLDERPTVPLETAGSIHLEHKENHFQGNGIRQGSQYRNHKSADKALTSKAMDHIREERHVEGQESCQRNATEPNGNESQRKMTSRNARRKKAKRQWLREVKKAEKAESDETGTQQKSEVHHSLDHENDAEEVVPIVVKPGHIRFEPFGQSEQPSQRPVETLKWNGTISKKKGQKWGREKNICSVMNDDNVPPEQLNAESVIEEADKGDKLAELEKLFPLTRLPKKGDVLAYKVVELSSSWCPELSSFRVGKVASYDSISAKIVLVQVPDYPITFHERDEEESGAQPNNSLYKEDGSLEIDFPALHDVRLFSEDKATTNASTSERALVGAVSAVCRQTAVSAARANQKGNGTVAQPTESVQTGGWEEICQALDAKKAELSQKKGWTSWDRKETSQKETSTSTPWSYRALWRSALGPTVSLLRSKNDI